MSCSILACSVSSALGDCSQACASALELGEIKSVDLYLDELEEPIDAPYFRISNPKALADHELMYQTTREVLRSLISQSGFDSEQLKRTGLFWGSSSFTVSDSERRYFGEMNNEDQYALPMPIVGYNKLPEQLAEEFCLSRCVHSYATACTSSANALIYADMYLARGDIDHAIVVGSEFYNSATVLGFYGLELLSRQKKIMPFDSRRDGLILGEGCAAVLVSKSIDAPTKFLGGASTTDHFSLTAANADGSTIASVIQKALDMSDTDPEKVDAIKVHGTASLLNDEAEAAGLKRVFNQSNMPRVFALKPYIGHTLGACGMVELALTITAIKSGFIPANPGLAEDGSDLGVALNQTPVAVEHAILLLNYFAFGGNNTSLVIEAG